MSKEKLQEKYILYQLLNQNLESLKQQMEFVEQQFIEVKSTMLSIDDLNKIGKENKIFLPLGSGCYGVGEITEKNEMLLNIGAGIFVNKKAAAAKSFLDKRVKELENASDEIQAQVERIVKQMNTLGLEIQELAKEGRKS